MKQRTFADADYAGKCEQTREEMILMKMDQLVPRKGLTAPFLPELNT